MNEKILVVNDDDGIRELTTFILQANGFTTIEAKDGSAGVEQAIQQKPDLILLDIMMPVMDGFEACQKLKASPIIQDVPVLFFSSLTNPQDKIKGLALGAVDFINNVVDQGELLARVQTHLKIQSLTRSLMDTNEQLIRKQKALDDDLQAAKAIQRSFLPSKTMSIPKLDVASTWSPANPLGGDIFNVIQCGQDKVVFYMVDVSGHDVPSALVTVSVSQYLQQKNFSSYPLSSPKEMMLSLDNEYPLDRFNRYFTIFYIVLDLSTGTFLYSSAGHPPAILLSKDHSLKLLELGGPVIGLCQGSPYDEGREMLLPGDKILLYTDGVTEMKNRNDEFYGTERLCALLEKNRQVPVAQIVSLIQASLNDFCQSLVIEDDISIMCLEFKGV